LGRRSTTGPRNTITVRPSPEQAFDDSGNDYRVTLAARKLASWSAWARIEHPRAAASLGTRGALSDTLRGRVRSSRWGQVEPSRWFKIAVAVAEQWIP
jgi:hypothetical protein